MRASGLVSHKNLCKKTYTRKKLLGGAKAIRCLDCSMRCLSRQDAGNVMTVQSLYK